MKKLNKILNTELRELKENNKETVIKERLIKS